MATDFGIRIIIDEAGTGGVPSDQVPEVVQKIIQLLRSDTLVLTHAAGYVAGSRTYNVTLSLNTITSADYGIEVLIDSGVSVNRKVAIVSKIMQCLSGFTLTLVLATTYAAGSSSTNQNTLTVT